MSETDTTSLDPESRAAGGQPDPSTVASLPDWAQRMVRELRQEAATHRMALQEATTARDDALAKLTDLHRRDATAGLSKTLADPDDLARYINVDELVDDAGHPDPARYQEAAKSLALERPHLAPRRPTRSGNEVHGGGSPRPAVDPDAAAQAGTEAFVSMLQGT